jgi:hypothetical protein
VILAILLAAAVPSLPGCVPGQKPAVRPAKVTIACADANFYVDRLRWSNWGTKSATATGTAHVKDCTPNCAAGRFHTYPATLTVSQPTRCNGRAVFTHVAWRFTRARPSGQPRTGFVRFGCL